MRGVAIGPLPDAALRMVEDALIDALGASRADAVRLEESASIRMRAHVPDMVPALQSFTVSVDEQAAKMSRGDALAVAWRDVHQLVELEREVRHWSQCDP